MADFYVNIFGTTHWGGSITPPKGSIMFNLHVLRVESDITPINFDMFIEFFAYPFNSMVNPSTPNLGTTIIAGGGSQPLLTNRREVNQPQIIHIDQMTPTIGNPTTPFNCTGFNPIVPAPIPPLSQVCPAGQLSLSNCPNPSDFRLFSHPFQLKTNISSSSGTFDPAWSNVTDSNDTFDCYEKKFLKLPIKITIIADGCRYESKSAISKIYMKYDVSNGTTNDLYGNAFCNWNPNYYPLGEFDKILVN